MLILKLAWRSLWRNRRRTLITVMSISLGITLALFFISMAEGMYKKLVDDAVRMQAGHITVENPAYRDALTPDIALSSIEAIRKAAEAIPGVERTKALILGQAVVSTGKGSAGVAMSGVEPQAEMATSPLAKRIIEGRFLRDDDERGAVVGDVLAKRLDLKPGKKLVITTNNIHGDLVSELLRVKGVFRVGSEEIDGFVIQVPLDVARRILEMGPHQANQVGVILASPDDQGRVREKLSQALEGRPVAVLPWQEVLPELDAYITLDRGSNIIMHGIILFLIAFTILNTILMSVLERSREFAILLALGTSKGLLRCQILAESALLGLVGCAAGLIIGGTLSYLAEVYGLDMRSMISEGMSISGFAVDPMIYSDLTVGQMVALGATIFVATILIGLYPMFRSTKIDLAEHLRTQ